MHEILRNLPPGSRVLDLGCRNGSFDASLFPVLTVRLDLERTGASGVFVQADAGRLPFADATFDALIANHSLEHIQELAAALREIGRVAKPGCGLFVAVPDAGTLTDKIYRSLARGGGHVNPFHDARALAARIGRETDLPLVALRELRTSLSFLNCRNMPSRAPRRYILVGGGKEWILSSATYLFRIFDRIAGTRLSVYGWAMYFGSVGDEFDTGTWTNVCVRCGSGHPSAFLQTFGWPPKFRCPGCGATNFFTKDRA